jgi:heme exporter protein D
MSIDELIKLATSVVSLMTAVIALLSTRNALLKGKRSRGATRKRKRKARKV